MAEIIKAFRESIPALRFIGKKYAQFVSWGEWFANGWFDEIERAMGGVEDICAIWKNGGGYIGLERYADTEAFTYWIGMFTPAGTPVPDGFSHVDFPQGVLGTCWIYGKEGEVHGHQDKCWQQLADQGIALYKDEQGAVWSFENCLCPRYTTPDEHGNIILDYCTFAE